MYVYTLIAHKKSTLTTKYSAIKLTLIVNQKKKILLNY